jgi:ribosomal protein L11 methyltransferase
VPDPYPVLDITGPDTGRDGLSWTDRIAAIVDDFGPIAIDPGEPGSQHVRVFFTSIAERDSALTAVAAGGGPGIRISSTSVADDGWAERSQADLRAIRVGRVIVAPPWDLPTTTPDDPDEVVVVQIRPALGFGSGHHPTTRLALLGLQQVSLGDHEVLDLGTGSGVLAVAAIKLGARAAIGVDRDPDALESARESLALNDLADRVEFRVGALADITGAADVVVANLTAATLIDQHDTIVALARPGGSLILSGVLATEAPAVSAAFETAGPCVWRGTEDEWTGLVFGKPTAG